jgi:hypothetical protein
MSEEMSAIQGLVRVERAERFDVDGPGTLLTKADLPTTVTIVNLSRSGCLFQSPHVPAMGATISIGIPGIGARQATVVRIAPEGIGCAFLGLLSEAEVAGAVSARRIDERDPSQIVRALRRSLPDSETPARRKGLLGLFGRR